MSSPTITAIDVLLISLGIAPLKYLWAWWMKHRAKKREKAIQKVVEESLKKEGK